MKIFTRVLVPDVEYKTLSISRTTSCREVIYMLLAKFRLRNRDPNLFFLTIDVWMRKTGIPIRSVMVLDEKTCPAQLQEVYPQQGTKFTLQMRRGELVRLIDDSCFTSSSSSPSPAVRLFPLLILCTFPSLLPDVHPLLVLLLTLPYLLFLFPSLCPVNNEDVLFPVLLQQEAQAGVRVRA